MPRDPEPSPNRHCQITGAPWTAASLVTCGYCYSPTSKTTGKGRLGQRMGTAVKRLAQILAHVSIRSDTRGIVAPRREAAAKPCAVPDLRQQLPLVIQRQEARGSCQSSTKGSRAGLGCWDPAGTATTAHPPVSRSRALDTTGYFWELSHSGNEHKNRAEACGARLALLLPRGNQANISSRHPALLRQRYNGVLSWLAGEETVQLRFRIKSRDGSVITWL